MDGRSMAVYCSGAARDAWNASLPCVVPLAGFSAGSWN
jgi:hypothetical protein